MTAMHIMDHSLYYFTIQQQKTKILLFYIHKQTFRVFKNNVAKLLYDITCCIIDINEKSKKYLVSCLDVSF